MRILLSARLPNPNKTISARVCLCLVAGLVVLPTPSSSATPETRILAQKKPPMADAISLKLIAAVRAGNLEQVTSTLAENANPNSRDEKGETPLLLAAQAGNAAIVEKLLAAGAFPYLRSTYGRSPIVEAADKGHTDVVKLLLPKKWEKKFTDSFGRTPLIAATENGNLDMMKMLIDSKALVDDQQNTGGTALMAATARGNLEAMRLLLAAKAKPEIRDRYGRPAIYHACVNGKDAALALLLKGANITRLKDAEGKTPLAATIDALCVLKDDMLAPRMGILDTLLAAGVPISEQDGYGQTALFAATTLGRLPLVRYLVEHKIDLTKRDSSNSLAITWAKRGDHQDVVTYLLQKGSPE